MTDQTAAEVSAMVLELLKQHGFICVGTFALPQYESDQEFNEYKEDYKYTDTETGFNDLARAARIKGEAKPGLYNLTTTALEFFESSLVLPVKFRNTLAEFGVASQEIPLQLNSINEESINVEQLLQNENSMRLIGLLKLIRNNIDVPDDEFFTLLDQMN